MKLTTNSQVDVTPKQVADMISTCSADEFAGIFFYLAKIINDDTERISEIGKAMSSDIGGLRKQLFKSIHCSIIYHEFKEFADKEDDERA